MRLMRSERTRRVRSLLPVLLAVLVPALLAPQQVRADTPDQGPDRAVIGGTPVRAEAHPWVVALSSRSLFGGSRSGQFCGGALVDARTAVTAAHCLSTEVLGVDRKKVSDLRIITRRGDLSGKTGQEVPVASTWVNPDYDSRTNRGDVAVLRLKEALPAKSAMRMAEPGDAAYKAGSAASVYGWGDTSGNGAYATSLRAARVNMLADEECARAYPGNSEGTFDAASMVCAGVENGGRDACQGDSGGPLIANGRLVGLVSWGVGCGERGRPGVYTRISAVADAVRAHSG